MLEETQDREEIIERVAALDIGKAELVACVRVPRMRCAPSATCLVMSSRLPRIAEAGSCRRSRGSRKTRSG